MSEQRDFDPPPNMRWRYHYLVFPADHVALLFTPLDAQEMPDAYVADDKMSRALRDALDKGYRWVRTDGAHAIFEKATLRLPGGSDN